MKPEEKRELERIAGDIGRSNKLRGILAGIAVGVIVVTADVVATGFVTAQTIKDLDRNAAVTVAAERGLRCIIKTRNIPERGPKRQAIFDRCYREFDRLAEEQDGP